MKQIKQNIHWPNYIFEKKSDSQFLRIDVGLGKNLLMKLKKKAVTFQQTMDVRYVGQSHELNIEFNPGFAESFHSIHNQRFGHAKHDMFIEIGSLRVRAVGKTEDSMVMVQMLGLKSDEKPYSKDVIFDGEI